MSKKNFSVISGTDFLVGDFAFSNILNFLSNEVRAIMHKLHIYFPIKINPHLFQKHGKFLLRNLIDFINIFFSNPKISIEQNKKKILIFNWRDIKHSFAGGAEVYIHELAKRWVEDGNHVTVFCGNDSKSPRNDYIDGVQIIRRGGFYLVYFWAFFYYIFKFRGRYDVIIDCENGIPFFTPLYAKEKKILVIHHVHQEVFRSTLIWPFANIAQFLELKAMPYVYKTIQTITVSPSSKDDIMKFKLSDIIPKIVYNGVDLNKYQPGTKSAKPLILYLGRLKYYKSIHVLIQSALKIVDKIPDAEFIIAGEGEEKNSLKKLVKNLGLESKISFVGKVTEDEKISLFQKAWIFVNPSLIEGWGITTIEANACGTPVIASDVSGLRDAVKNPHTGYLVKYGDIDSFSKKIETLIKDSDLRKTMSENSIKWAQQFSWEKSAQEAMKYL